MIQEIKETEPNSQRGTNPRANQTLSNNIIPDEKSVLNPLYSILSDNNIQEGIKETINKSSQMSAYQNMEKKDKPYWDKSFVNFDRISLNGKYWRDWSELEKKSFIEGFNEGKLGNPDTDNGHCLGFYVARSETECAKARAQRNHLAK